MRIGLPVYFGKIEINGCENVDFSKPIIFAPNHQNAFLDAILVSIFSKKPVYYLTRADIFVKRYEWFLTALKMIPVYRIRDGYSKLAMNEAIFDRCTEILDGDGSVLIFPEGHMHKFRYLKPLTKGISRLALQAQISIPDSDIHIVPVGINYIHHNKPRNKVYLNFGLPISVQDYTNLYVKDKAKALIMLKNDVQEEMQQQLLISVKSDDYIDKLQFINPKSSKFGFSELKSAIAHCVAPIQSIGSDNQSLIRIFTFLNFPPHYFLSQLIRQKIKEPLLIGSIKSIVGIFVFPIWWILVLILTTTLFNSVYLSFSLLIIMISSLFYRAALRNRSEG